MATRIRNAAPPLAGPTQTVAWCGFSLQMPAEWNLSVERGDAADGTVCFADLQRTQLEVRWQTLRESRVATRHDQLLRQLQQRGATLVPLQGNLPGMRVEHQGRLLTLLRGRRRLYELTWFPQAAGVQAMAAGFADHQPEAWWPWQLYGLQARVPAEWTLAKRQLLPGERRLEFRRRGAVIVAGSWSLADRLLAGRSLQAWAEASIPLVKRGRGVGWETVAESRASYAVTSRGLWGKITTRLCLWHNAAANAIVWLETRGGRRGAATLEEAARQFSGS